MNEEAFMRILTTSFTRWKNPNRVRQEFNQG
jgi:hypothetical protein